VFTKPAGGWSGTIDESAKLTVANASFPCSYFVHSVAIDGRTIAVACSGHAYVFTEPGSGWVGTIQPSATLVAPSTSSVQSVAVLDSSVVTAGEGQAGDAANPVVFNQPANGWSGTIQPAASLKVSRSAQDLGFAELVASSGNQVAALVIPQRDNDCELGTCGGTLYAFTQPPSGWKGTIGGLSTSINLASGYPLAVEGRTIATGGNEAIDLFNPRPGKPSATKASLSGLASAKPELHFKLEAGQDAAKIRSLKLALPAGLRFVRQHAGRTRGVGVNVRFRAARLRPGTLTLTLRLPAQSLAITIGGPAISEQKNLIASIRRVRKYNRAHRRKRVLPLKLRCAVTDATGRTTSLTLKIRIS
jgi:hypothetical protein